MEAVAIPPGPTRLAHCVELALGTCLEAADGRGTYVYIGTLPGSDTAAFAPAIRPGAKTDSSHITVPRRAVEAQRAASGRNTPLRIGESGRDGFGVEVVYLGATGARLQPGQQDEEVCVFVTSAQQSGSLPAWARTYSLWEGASRSFPGLVQHLRPDWPTVVSQAQAAAARRDEQHARLRVQLEHEMAVRAKASADCPRVLLPEDMRAEHAFDLKAGDRIADANGRLYEFGGYRRTTGSRRDIVFLPVAGGGVPAHLSYPSACAMANTALRKFPLLVQRLTPQAAEVAEPATQVETAALGRERGG